MLELILPPAASVAETRSDQETDLFPIEEAHVARAVPRRRREFATGRRCAREALAGLGGDLCPIEVGRRGEPLWPAGYAGSITHCRGYRGSAVAHTAQLRSIGIDAEPHERLPDDLLATIAAPVEIEHLYGLAASMPTVHWDRLLFSAKESIYKALYPVDHRPLGFTDATVEIDPAGSFLAHVLPSGDADSEPGFRPDPQVQFVRGRWAAIDGLLLAAVVIRP